MFAQAISLSVNIFKENNSYPHTNNTSIEGNQTSAQMLVS